MKRLVEREHKTFEIVFVKTGHSYRTMGFKVSPIVRKDLLDKEFVYIADTRCKVVDRLDLEQCFKCQKIGHISTNNRDQGLPCMYCSGSHWTGSCSDKCKKQNHNCSHSEDETLRNNSDTHSFRRGNMSYIYSPESLKSFEV